MAAFSSAAFAQTAFSVAAFDFGSTPATTGGGTVLQARYAGHTREDREQRRIEREELDRIPEEARDVIDAELALVLETQQVNEAALKHRFEMAQLAYETRYLRALIKEVEWRQMLANNDTLIMLLLLQ